MEILTFLLVLLVMFANSTSCTLIVNQTDTVLTVPINITVTKEEVSFCISLRFEETPFRVTTLGEYEVLEDLSLVLRFDDAYGWVMVKQAWFMFLIPKEHEFQPFTWTKICFSSNVTDYHVVVQGKLWYEGKRSYNHPPLKGTILHKVRFGQLFQGGKIKLSLSKLSIWPTFIMKEKLLRLSENCKNELAGEILEWQQITQLLPQTNSPSIIDIDEDIICHTFTQKVIQPIPLLVTYETARQVCQKLGGILHFPGLYGEKIALKVSKAPCQFNYAYWVPLIKLLESNNYLLESTNERMKFSEAWSWGKLEPNGGDLQNCTVISDNGTLADATCSTLRCPLCEFQNNVKFTLRGLTTTELAIDQQYLMIPSTFEGDFPAFQGFNKNRIIRQNDNKWQIVSEKNQVVAESLAMVSDELPIGLLEWNFFTDKGNKTVLPLKLTKVKWVKSSISLTS